MKFRPIYLLVAAPLLFGAAVPFALAQTNSTPSPDAEEVQPGERRERFKEMRKNRMERMVQELGLTQDQQTRIRSIWENARNDKNPQRQQLRTEMENLRSLMARSASTSELRQQHNKIKALRDQMGDQRFETMLQMYEVLTPQQRTKFAEMMQKRGGMRGRRGGQRGPQAFLPLE
jgi:Spy/CpxP family protein refolding chaperone